MTVHARAIAPDAASVRQFFDIINEHAAHAFEGVDRPGYLQLVRIHPMSENAVSQRFRIGDVDGMVRAALHDAANGHNVYVEGRTVIETARGRGKLEDTRGVFALVIDSDADKGKAGQVETLPSLMVETSPGNAHHWLFLDRAVGADEARTIGDAMRAATGADADTGVITQPYRVAGTPNFPGAKKQARGRVTTSTRILQHRGTRWSADELRSVFPAQQRKGTGADGTSGRTSFEVIALVAEIATGDMDRSAQFQRAVNAAVRAGMTPADLEALMRQHPQGCAGKYLTGRDRLREEIERSWPKAEQKQAEAAAETETDLARLNAKYCVIRDGGRTRVLTFDPHQEKGHRRLVASYLSFEDFRNFHCNKAVRVGDRSIPLGHWWLKHGERRQYEGVTFQPGAGEEIEGRLNLWRGWGGGASTGRMVLDAPAHRGGTSSRQRRGRSVHSQLVCLGGSAPC